MTVLANGRRAARGLAALTAICAGAVALVPGAFSEDAPAAAPQSVPPPASTADGGFDYWQPEWLVRDLWGPGRMPKGMMVRLLRHTTYVHMGVPKEYEGAQSPLEPGPKTTAAGAALYAQHCARCHGGNGMGNGEAGNALTPSPALLAYMIRRPISADEYLLWAISDGGKQFESAMPSFKEVLSREEIWSIVAYMRAGFPRTGTPPAKPD